MEEHVGWFLEHAYLIPLIMFCSALIILAVGKRLPERITSGIGILAVLVCCLMSFGVAANWIDRTNNPPEHGTETSEHSAEAGTEGTATDTEGHESEEPAATEETPAGEGEHAAAALPTAGGEEGGEAAGEEEAEAHHSVPPVVTSVTWFHMGGIEIEVGTLVDGLTAMMLVTVTIISLLVHIYSKEYLHDDVRFTHYYAFLSFFTSAMLFYVMGMTTLQMLVGWELVGVCSFALIGHWWEEKANTDAALKAFLTNRVGDVGLLLGVVILYFAAKGTFNVLDIDNYALEAGANQTLLLVGALCLFAGVTSKSGQFPLHTWLPDAMAGPTPVSALIHAATMVVAGVYLVARLYSVFYEGLNIGDNWINYVAVIGGVTVIIGAVLAFVQQDLKKVLAYSTISQLGYMVMALGVGAWTAGVFHLFTHAFFKACLFLGAGSVSHAAHHTFDMRKMGGLKKHMPITFWTFIIGTAALMGIFPLAGFWSKDEVLAGAQQGQNGGAYILMLAFGVIGAMLTAAYMTRAVIKTFYGEYKGHGTPHESPKVMTIPLIILAGGAIVLGFTNLPHFFQLDGVAEYTTRFEHFVEPTFAFPENNFQHPEFTPWLAVLSTAVVALGFFLAYSYYWKKKSPFMGLSQKAPFNSLYTFVENKYYLDKLYQGVIVKAFTGPIARAAYWFNMNVLDGIVNGLGKGTVAIGRFTYKYVDQGVVDRVIVSAGPASEESGQVLRKIQTGKVQQYAAILFIAAALIAGALVVFL